MTSKNKINEREALEEMAEYAFRGELPGCWEEVLRKYSPHEIEKALTAVQEYRPNYPQKYFLRILERSKQYRTRERKVKNSNVREAEKRELAKKSADNLNPQTMNKEGMKRCAQIFKEKLKENANG